MAILHTCQHSLFIYSDFSSLPTAPVLGVRTGKGKKDKETVHRWSFPTQPLMLGLKPQHKPRTSEGAGFSQLLRAHPRRGQARPPSTVLAMAIKRVTPNEISCPKMNSHTGTTIQQGFHTPGHTQAKSSSVTHGQISELEAMCLTFLWLCEDE